MPSPAQQILLDSVGMFAALLYGVVAAVLGQRRLSRELAGAMRAFQAWWGGLAAVILLAIVWRRLELGHSLAAQLAYTSVVIVLLSAALAGLLYYLLMIYTGDRRWFRRVAAGYALFAAALVAFVLAQDPYVMTGPEGHSLAYRAEFAPTHPASILVTAFLLLPPLVGAGAYIRLFGKVDTRVARYRIALVAGGILLWFGYSALGSATTIAQGGREVAFAEALGGQLLGVLSAVLVLLAYKPPRPIARRLESEPRPRPEEMRLPQDRLAIAA